MSRAWLSVHEGKLYLVHRTGYLAFTPEEWQALKEAGDALLRPDPPVVLSAKADEGS